MHEGVWRFYSDGWMASYRTLPIVSKYMKPKAANVTFLSSQEQNASPSVKP